VQVFTVRQEMHFYIERYQLDETIVTYYHKYLYMFRASICPSSGVEVEQKPVCSLVHCV